VKYVEKAGTGTTDMIADCREAGLPEPDFRQCGPHVVTTLWRDWLTSEAMVGLGLNERQRTGVAHLKSAGRITNREYQELTGANRQTSLRDLRELLAHGIVAQIGTTGRGAYYRLQARS
jgi:ATP-dependent DNA helicase RecG